MSTCVNNCPNCQCAGGKDDTDEYFCIGADGRLWILGNHGDYEAAEDTAKSLEVEVVWMFGKQTAIDWRDSLLQALPIPTPPQVDDQGLELLQRSLRALSEDDFPELRNQLRTYIRAADDVAVTELCLAACIPSRKL